MAEDKKNPLWGGRFGGAPDKAMEAINASIPVDKNLWREDIRASRAHVAMLDAQGIIQADAAKRIDEGLQQVAEEYERDGITENLALEDIHMHVEIRLKELIGEDAEVLRCVDEVHRMPGMVEAGTSSDRQRKVYADAMAAGKSNREALCGVVRHLIEEFTADL